MKRLILNLQLGQVGRDRRARRRSTRTEVKHGGAPGGRALPGSNKARIAVYILLFALLLIRARAADEAPQHWSFLPLKAPALPPVHGTERIRTPVDQFILARLEEKKLSLSNPAAPLKLVRRIYFDLIGLPPTPDQINEFFAASTRDSRAAVASLVDELLASPQYGERWARHWLDVARYADSNGQESDEDRPTAYHYRDFAIRALNDDLPFDTFLRWQLAGDELEPDNPLAVAATGFIVAGTHIILEVPMEEEKIRTRYNELDDMIATTGSAMLGLTLACARCHDHKYDAIPTRDYYHMLSAFNSGDPAEVPLVPLAEVRRQRETEGKWKAEFEPAKKRLDHWLKEARSRYNPDPNKQPPKISDQDLRALFSDKERDEWDALAAEIKQIESRKPKPLPTALAFADFGAKPRENWLLARGDFRSKKEPLELGFLSALTRNKTPANYWAAARNESRRDDSTQQRRALAEWMTDLEHGAGALAARVIVNRVWQHHFGEGLVRTVNDFGVRSDPPAHPELLEWLTAEFVQSGWKLKALHRMIVNSSVYLQDSAYDSAKANADPENRLFWRRTPLRIESEILRDSILAVSGTLNREMFGPAFKPPIAIEAIQARNVKDPYPKDAKDTPATRRRAIYMFHKRVVQHPLMQAFDGPDAQASCGRRENTTVAPQALALLNDRFIRTRAADFALRLAQEAGPESEAQVRLAWRLALSRDPSATELKSCAGFIDTQAGNRSTRNHSKNGIVAPDSADSVAAHGLALVDFCQALFALNEFIYVD